jgi:mRNA interferase MazF
VEIARGHLVVAAFPGDYSKPRPALVAQSNAFDGLESVTLLPLTTDLRDWPLFRVPVEPHPENGLRQRSHVMVDKATTISRLKVSRAIGHLDQATMRAVDTALMNFFGLGDS